MKWFLRIAGLLGALAAVAVAALLVMGQGANANQLQQAVEIDRPPADVWPYLYQEDKLKQWVAWLVEAKPSEEPMKGKRGIWVMRDENNGGALMRIESTVTAAEPARLLAVDLATAGFTGHGLYSLAALPGGRTRLETAQRYTFDHWFAKLLTPVVIRAAGAKAKTDLLRLKAAVEGQPTAR